MAKCNRRGFAAADCGVDVQWHRCYRKLLLQSLCWCNRHVFSSLKYVEQQLVFCQGMTSLLCWGLTWGSTRQGCLAWMSMGRQKCREAGAAGPAWSVAARLGVRRAASRVSVLVSESITLMRRDAHSMAVCACAAPRSLSVMNAHVGRRQIHGLQDMSVERAWGAGPVEQGLAGSALHTWQGAGPAVHRRLTRASSLAWESLRVLKERLQRFGYQG
jgi:hypothetical protein